MTQNLKATVRYDGTGFAGWQVQPGLRTVQGELENALAQIASQPVRIHGAGRTDAGVHSIGQVVSFDAHPGRLDPDRLQRSLNSLLAPGTAVRDIEIVGPDFDARFSARARWYRYRVLSNPVPDPLRAGLVWQVREPLDGAAMARASEVVVGEHDFSSFCRRPKPGYDGVERTLVRRVLEARWVAVDDEWHFEIGASSFCHQMVRSLTGTLVDVGRGQIGAGRMAEILAAGDRNRAGIIAPPQGLVFIRVDY